MAEQQTRKPTLIAYYKLKLNPNPRNIGLDLNSSIFLKQGIIHPKSRYAQYMNAQW